MSAAASRTAGKTIAAADTATTTTAVATTVPRPTTTTSTTAAPTTTRPPPTVPPPPTTIPSGPAPAGLAPGASGPTVAQLQQNLTALGYWAGTVDGNYGGTTSQAVMAVQKAAGLTRNGVFGPETAAALASGVKPTPQSTSGHVIEIDLTHQLLLIVTNGHVDSILNTSTGGGYTYVDQGQKQVAKTPVGHFTTTWQVDGLRVSSLGELWRPKYFVGGYAIHGSGSVPGYPASHGCVRVSNDAIDWIWATGVDPIGTPVWVY